MKFLAIAGTGGARSSAKGQLGWEDPRSEFSRFLRGFGIEPYHEDPASCFGWDGSLDGLDAFNLTWDYYGRALFQWFVPPNAAGGARISPKETFIITHSHGGNLVAYACGQYGLKVEGLITVGMPIRADMQELYQAAAPNIKRHAHLHSGWRDFWQVLGAFLDGRKGIHRKHPTATVNYRMPGGHGNVLREPELFPFWRESGVLELFAGGPVDVVSI